MMSKLLVSMVTFVFLIQAQAASVASYNSPLEYETTVSLLKAWSRGSRLVQLTQTATGYLLSVTGPEMMGDNFRFLITPTNEGQTQFDFQDDSLITEEKYDNNKEYVVRPITDAIEKCDDDESTGLECFNFKVSLSENSIGISFYPYSDEDDDYGTDLKFSVDAQGKKTSIISRFLDDDGNIKQYYIKEERMKFFNFFGSAIRPL